MSASSRAALLCLCAALVPARAHAWADAAQGSEPAAQAAASETPGTDPRVAEADALLGDRASYDRAIALYADALAGAPGDAAVRQRRARVLSWAGRLEEAIAEYDHVLASPAAPPDVRVERAEVLSWAGRLAEAEAEFRALLAGDPSDARAARGLARTLNWSGRKADADRAFERALSLGEDAELRGEWAALRAGYRPGVVGETDFYEDNLGFQRLAQSAEAAGYFDLDTRLSVRATRLDVEQSGIEALGLAESDLGHELAAGVERRFGERWTTELALGARAWDHAGSLPVARGRVTFTPGPGAAYTAAFRYSDALAGTDSLAAVEADVKDATGELSLWRDLGRTRELYGRLAAGFLSDGNQRRSAEISLAWRPFDPSLLLGGALGYLGYADPSPFYYHPELDATGRLFGRWRRPFARYFTLDLDASAGYGVVREDGLTSDGPSYEVLGALTWARGRLHVALRAGHARSQRAITYSGNRATLVLGLDF